MVAAKRAHALRAARQFSGLKPVSSKWHNLILPVVIPAIGRFSMKSYALLTPRKPRRSSGSQMRNMEFKQLSPDDFNKAYALVNDASEWLKLKHLPNWLVPSEIYYQRHADGQNYGLFVDNVLRAVVTLSNDYPHIWRQSIKHQGFIWLATLASAREVSKVEYGKILVQFAEQYAASQGKSAVYLDCYYSNGKLPLYYEQCGYKLLERKMVVFDDESKNDSVLMVKELNS
jgi:GNAT superfamily N-acetyltransferase